MIWEQNAIMTNDTQTDETGRIPETPAKLVSQLSANVLTFAPTESISATTSKEIELKNGDSGESTNTINSLSNKFSAQSLKGTNNFKQHLVKEVKPKIPKENHSQSPNGKNEGSCSKPDSNKKKSSGLELFNSDSSKGPLLKSVKTTNDANTGTRTNCKNGNPSHHYTTLLNIVSSEESPPSSNQPNLTKSPQKDTSDARAVEEQKSPQTRVLQSFNTSDASSHTSPIVPNEQLAQTTTQVTVTVDTGSGNPSLSTTCSEHTEHVSTIVSGYEKQPTTSAASPATTLSKSTTGAELSGIEIEVHPKQCKLKTNYTQTKTDDYSSATNFTADIKPITTSDACPATTLSESTTTTEQSGMKQYTKRHILKASRTKSKTSSSAANGTGDDKLTTTSDVPHATTLSEPTTITELSGMKQYPKQQILKVSYTQPMTSDYSSAANVARNDTQTNPHVELYTQNYTSVNSSATDVNGDDKQATTSGTIKSEFTTTAELSCIELHPKRRKLKASFIKSETSDKLFATNITADLGNDTQKTNLTTTSGSTTTTDQLGSGKALHPRRRKLKASHTKSKTSDNSSATKITAVENNLSSLTREPVPFTNNYQTFLNIRKQIHNKHMSLFPVQPKPPSGYEDYLMNSRKYVLDGNYKSRVVNTQTPSPANLHKQLKNLFVEQEKERQKLRMQHIVDKEKLVLSVEQEILRVHGRAARALANQPLPFSACTIIKDDEVYNIMTPEQEKTKDKHVRSRYNGRVFMSWLQDIDDKWENIKISMLLRQHNEAESLHAIQKMDWGWKLKELQLCTFSSLEPNIDKEHVPIVLVNEDFDHFPA